MAAQHADCLASSREELREAGSEKRVPLSAKALSLATQAQGSARFRTRQESAYLRQDQTLLCSRRTLRLRRQACGRPRTVPPRPEGPAACSKIKTRNGKDQSLLLQTKPGNRSRWAVRRSLEESSVLRRLSRRLETSLHRRGDCSCRCHASRCKTSAPIS